MARVVEGRQDTPVANVDFEQSGKDGKTWSGLTWDESVYERKWGCRSLGRCSKMPQTQTFLSHYSEGWRLPTCQVPVRTCFWAVDFSLYPHMMGKGPFYKGTDLLHGTPSLWPDCPPFKGPTSWCHHLLSPREGLGFQPKNCKGTWKCRALW